MSARAYNNFLKAWKVFKTEKQNGRQIHYENVLLFNISRAPIVNNTCISTFLSTVVIYPKAIHCVYLKRFNYLQLFYY